MYIDAVPVRTDERGQVTLVGDGALVQKVMQGTPAEEAGLEAKDVITAVEGERVTDGIALIVAIRTHQPGETIEFTVVRDGDERTVEVTLGRTPGGVVLGVRDFGPGIPREEQGRIFERFYRAQSARDRNVRGSGIGLALVRHIAEAHGGRVTVESPIPDLSACTPCFGRRTQAHPHHRRRA